MNWYDQAKPRRRDLSRLEWFGLVSGIIGLIADGLGLVLLAFQWDSRSATGSPTTWIAAVWALLFFGILYTVVLAGFYARRFGYLKHRQIVRTWSFKDRQRIERGSRALSLVIGVPLLLAYCTVGAVALASAREGVTAADLFGAATLGGMFMGGLISLVIFPLNDGSMHLFALFEPSYNDTLEGEVDFY